ncbi:hypothetical protein RHSIM_Rhsim01G0088300 [Rhododendron simsii]|uniref:Uncharacterized protein n=1 Tax=Rhododendron simsii TaxID=118357 RepID=A0A834HQI6_RHOSS|nr:hypothetical protein RHSIM_Rhsim01G0088300 [Rhododendron simsii]
MPLISTVIVSWCKNHPDGEDDGDDGYDYAPAACMEGDGDDDDDDGDYDYAPAAPLEGDDDDDDGDYDYAPAA